jgi:hypothetical protein
MTAAEHQQEITMKKIIAVATLAFVLAAGSAAVLIVHPQIVMACPNQTC